MTQVKIELLQDELAGLQLAAGYLQYSTERCRYLIGQEGLPPEQLERLESLTNRFARLADLLIQRVFRLVDEIELTGGGSLLDRIYRAEKRGWANAAELITIRELRNLIAQEYATEKMLEIYTAVAALSPILLATVPRVIAYANITLRIGPAVIPEQAAIHRPHLIIFESHCVGQDCRLPLSNSIRVRTG